MVVVSESELSVSSELDSVCVFRVVDLAEDFAVGSATDGIPVLVSTIIFGTGLDVRARIKRGWFSTFV